MKEQSGLLMVVRKQRKIKKSEFYYTVQRYMQINIKAFILELNIYGILETVIALLGSHLLSKVAIIQRPNLQKIGLWVHYRSKLG